MSAEKIISYYQDTDLEHVLGKPQLYLGSIKKQTNELYVYDEKESKFVFKKLKFARGWYKIVDEVLVNALDHWTNFPNKVTQINISFNDKGVIIIRNNGPGIPLDKFTTIEKEVIYLPQAIASAFKMGSNLDPNVKRITGGTHGLGLKLTNAFSSYLKFTTVKKCKTVIKKYTQIYREQLSVIEEPEIKNMPKGTEEYTEIEFLPVYSKMGYKDLLDEDINVLYELIQSRAYQAAICTTAQIYFNNILIDIFNENDITKSIKPVNSKHTNKFITFAHMFLDNDYGLYHTVLVNQKDPELNWDICLGISDGKFKQISLINGIYVEKGGNHILHIQNEIVSHIKSKVERAITKNNKFNPNFITNQLFIIFKASMDRPSFSSQIKTELDDPIEDFADYKFKASEWTHIWNFLEQHIMSQFLDKMLDKKKNKVNRKKIHLEKGTDALFAGDKKKSKQTSLIICEGDSALGTVHNGITHSKTKLSYDYYGTYSIQGVPMNARKECKISYDKLKKINICTRNTKLKDNQRFKDLVEISGLDYGKSYDPDTEEGRAEFETLRYGRIIIAVDQDEDGKGNIFGLIVNFLLLFWPNLTKWNYIKRFNTPIIRAYVKGSKTRENICFYSLSSYYDWKKTNFANDEMMSKKYYIKYYKGLGSHDQKRGEIFYIFDNFENKLINYSLDNEGIKDLEIYYGKLSGPRKIVLSTPIDDADFKESDDVPISVMLRTDVKEYQRDNIIRKIPSMVDGMSPAKRKVLYTARNEFGTSPSTNKEINVNNFTGGVIKYSHYHHGEASLNETITKMGQDFPGSKNLPFLVGIGQFGTRKEGGKDHAAARYVTIKLNQKLTFGLFPKEDDFILDYEFYDGARCEPSYYVPIIPISVMEYIEIPATGWKSKVLARNYKHVFQNVENMIKGKTNKCKTMGIWLKDNNCDLRTWQKEMYVVGKYYYNEKEQRIYITELPPCVYDTAYINSVAFITKKNDPSAKKVLRPEFVDFRSDSNFDEVNNKHNVIIWFKLKDANTINEIRKFTRAAKDVKDYPFDGVEEFMNLKMCLKSNLNFIANDGVIKEYKRYGQVVDDWFVIRKNLYKDRIERHIILVNLMIKYLKNIIRFAEEREKYNITVKTKEAVFMKILEKNKYDTFNKELLFSPKYTKVEELESLIINNPVNGTSYNYIINLSYRQLLEESSIQRKKKLEEEKQKLNEIIDDTADKNGSFTGKNTWLKELADLKKIIEEGIVKGWNHDDRY